MKPSKHLVAFAVLALLSAVSLYSWGCSSVANETRSSGSGALAPTASADEPDVMQSVFCAKCHPNQYAEHEQSTHGRAFTDEEVRLATARFSHQDCIICHTPRPIFETGIGMNPMKRMYDLEEGNTCMTCHWRPGYDYGQFGGGAQCKTAFAPAVGTVEACASCHRNHGTPFQWEQAPSGKLAGRVCIDCHMAGVTRAVAVGGPVRETHSHVFPGGRNEAHVRRAYAYEAKIEGNTAVVTITNKGAGHNFPTELKQRAVESLVIVRDAQGQEVARSRMTFRDPYKRPYGLELPVNTQIPSGQSREHRVPIGVAGGTVECQLFYKLYFPIEDEYPDLSRQLETRTLPFSGLAPSTEEVVSDPEVVAKTPGNIAPELAGAANLVDFVRPKIGKVAVDIPQGDSPEDIQKLVQLFQFPVPEANDKARARLTELGAKAVPALMEGLGSWDNKTFNQSMQVLQQIGAPAIPAIEKGLSDSHLYVRRWSRELAMRMKIQSAAAQQSLLAGLAMENALDRASSALALGSLKVASAAPQLRKLLEDTDPDVVRAAGLALAQLGAKDATDAIHGALVRAHYPEIRRDLAAALADLGDARGIPALTGGLDIADDLVRESFFDALYAATGMFEGYEPLAPRAERLAAIARIEARWAKTGGPEKLLPRAKLDPKKAARALKLVTNLGGSDMGPSTSDDDQAALNELVDIHEDALPALMHGLKWAPGFADKRVLVCNALGQIGDERAAPALCYALRDPVLATAAWACWALERVGEKDAIPAITRYQQRLRAAAVAGQIPPNAGSPEMLLLQAARARLMLGDEHARSEVVAGLLSRDEGARQLALDALRKRYQDDKGYDPLAPEEERAAAVKRWLE
ncbi:MAG: HEAT repeat domain-containing protein [Planctomycetes bacterium]|nr:HEAT repeat domain-containing protein [Planctomycetota bacterium]